MIFSDRNRIQTAGKFKSSVILFDSEQHIEQSKCFIQKEKEYDKFRWNLYSKFIELKMPETAAHAQAGSELADIVRNSILNQCYVGGTTMFASGLRSYSTACITLNFSC